MESDALLVCDAAPVCFGSAGNLFGIEEKAVDVAAVGAVHFLPIVEVGEFVPVDFNIVASFHCLESVEWKTNAVVDLKDDVEEDDRKKNRVNQGGGDGVIDFSFAMAKMFHTIKMYNLDIVQ